jgi:predicted nucleic acid-binding Zn ribbon protein
VKRRGPRPISIAVEALGEALAPESPLARVQSIWVAVAGADIAAHASPVSERGGTLTVRCSSAVWAAELDMRSGELTGLLNAELQPAATISRLRFVSR